MSIKRHEYNRVLMNVMELYERKFKNTNKNKIF